MKISGTIRLIGLGMLIGVPLWSEPDHSNVDSPAAVILRSRAGLQSILDFARLHPDLFPPSKLKTSRFLTRQEKETVWMSWKSYLDYLLALDSIGNGKPAFAERYAAFLSGYRQSLDWIRLIENDPGFRVILNEPVPEMGLPAKTYDRFKFRFLNVARASELTALSTIYKTKRDEASAELQSAIDEDASAIWKQARGNGEVLTLKNAMEVMRNAGFTAWFPVQTGVSTWMGDTKVYRKTRSLISAEQIEAIKPKLEPGDILIERREWYLSNIGLPGFWPHAALYVGTPEQRRSYFKTPDVDAWLKTLPENPADFESLLKARSSQAYSDSIAPYHGHAPVILEAMSEGVIFTSIEHSADADSLAVLRPRNSKAEKAEAVRRAFHYAGRPYDFNFDFLTDSTIVCSELVYKAYEPAGSYRGMRFPLVTMLGRPVSPPNEFVRQFDEQFDTPAQQSDLILFLDGYERGAKAVNATVADFRTSWKRPKWHVLLKEAPVQ